MKTINQQEKKISSSFKCKSFSTTTVDSYEAGIEIGEALKEIQPEVILLFASIYYDYIELFDAIYSSLGTHDVIIFGGSGDGIYETERVANNGISGLAINGGKRIQWTMAIRTDAHIDPYRSAQECARELLNQSQTPIKLACVFADRSCNGVKIVDGISDVIKVPFIGGLTGDDWQFNKGYIFLNGQIYENAMGILGMSGFFSYAINTASGWKPMGKMGFVEESHQNVVGFIDGKTTFNFLEEQSGMPVSEVSLGVFPLAIYESPHDQRFFLRTAYKMRMESGEVSYFGGIKKGTWARVCRATHDDVLGGVNDAIAGIGTLSFDPACAVVISCGARKWLLRDRVGEETSRLFDSLGKKLPLVGFPSFGEMGPFHRENDDYTPVFFHNVSYVVLLLGPTQ